MSPTRLQAELRFAEAFECASYRPARRDGLSGRPERTADALRAVLIGCAAFHLMLLSSPPEEEAEVMAAAGNFAAVLDDEGPAGGVSSARLLQTYLRLYRLLCPLDVILATVAEEFRRESPPPTASFIFLRRRRLGGWNEAARNSVRYALNFFERQQAGLAERPEIALLDE